MALKRTLWRRFALLLGGSSPADLMQTARHFRGLSVFLGATAVALMVPVQARDAMTTLLGNGSGLRHVLILAREPGTVAREYRNLLGFAPAASRRETGDP